MQENTPSLPRIHTEKRRPPAAFWRKVPHPFSSPSGDSESEFSESVIHSLFASVSTEEYEVYMKQQDVKTEVTMTTVVQEPSVVVSKYELEQRSVTTPMSFVSETVLPLKRAGCYVEVRNCQFIFTLNSTNLLHRSSSSQPLKSGSSRRSSSAS